MAKSVSESDMASKARQTVVLNSQVTIVCYTKQARNCLTVQETKHPQQSLYEAVLGQKLCYNSMVTI